MSITSTDSERLTVNTPLHARSYIYYDHDRTMFPNLHAFMQRYRNAPPHGQPIPDGGRQYDEKALIFGPFDKKLNQAELQLIDKVDYAKVDSLLEKLKAQINCLDPEEDRESIERKMVRLEVCRSYWNAREGLDSYRAELLDTHKNLMECWLSAKTYGNWEALREWMVATHIHFTPEEPISRRGEMEELKQVLVIIHNEQPPKPKPKGKAPMKTEDPIAVATGIDIDDGFGIGPPPPGKPHPDLMLKRKREDDEVGEAAPLFDATQRKINDDLAGSIDGLKTLVERLDARVRTCEMLRTQITKTLKRWLDSDLGVEAQRTEKRRKCIAEIDFPLWVWEFEEYYLGLTKSQSGQSRNTRITYLAAVMTGLRRDGGTRNAMDKRVLAFSDPPTVEQVDAALKAGEATQKGTYGKTWKSHYKYVLKSIKDWILLPRDEPVEEEPFKEEPDKEEPVDEEEGSVWGGSDDEGKESDE